MSLGQRIAELRIILGLSQNQLARTLGVSRQAVSKWETDQSAPDSMNLIRLAEILETDIEYLTTGRRSFASHPPVVVKKVETVEKLVEKPVIQTVETVVEKIVEKPVVEFIEKPVVKKVYRKIYVRNPIEFLICGLFCCVIGFLIGLLF